MPTPGEIIYENGTAVGGVDSTGAVARFGAPAPVATAATPTAVATTTPTPTVPGVPTASSTEYRGQLADIQSQINKMNSTPFSGPTTTYNGQTVTTGQLYDQYRSQLETRRANEIARLNAEFDQAQIGQKEAQRKETGSSSMGLARVGGFDSASGQAVLTNLERVHESEQQALLAKRQAAINAAQTAYEDKQFEVAQKQLQEARDIEKTIYERQQDFVNNSLTLYGQQRQDLQFQADEAQRQYQRDRDTKADQKLARDFAYEKGITTPFYVIGGVGYDTSTGEALTYDEYINRGGAPDFSNAPVLDRDTELVRDFVGKLALQYADAGIDPLRDDIETARQKIQGSRIYAKETYIAPRDAPQPSDTQLRGAYVADARQLLLDMKGDDEKVNPDEYRAIREEFTRLGYGKLQDFYQEFPPDLWIAEQNLKGDLAPTYRGQQQEKLSSDGAGSGLSPAFQSTLAKYIGVPANEEQ